MAQGNGMQHSAANRQMIQILLRFPEFAAHFDRLAQEWQYHCLIHGDVKWDNCMLINTESGLKAKIIDWELANWGDPAWDVGCIFAAFLAGWIQALPPSATRVPGQFDAFSERCLAEMQPSVHAFWNAYCAARNLPEAACRSYLVQCLRYGAARLVQTAYEHLQFSSAVDANTYLLLQGSCNMLTRPDEAVEELLSL
jgi:aminoglycoside phosphotransferase (APT) family kinase protein